VSKLPDLTAINERCMELQQSKHSGGSGSKARRSGGCDKGGGCCGGGGAPSLGQIAAAARGATKPRGCPFLKRPPPGAAPGGLAAAGTLEEFKELVLAAPADVEDLARMGRAKGVCPYYGSRLAVPEADIILAPYRWGGGGWHGPGRCWPK
jgi:chromosome transmission fidelity protein 1